MEGEQILTEADTNLLDTFRSQLEEDEIELSRMLDDCRDLLSDEEETGCVHRDQVEVTEYFNKMLMTNKFKESLDLDKLGKAVRKSFVKAEKNFKNANYCMAVIHYRKKQDKEAEKRLVQILGPMLSREESECASYMQTAANTLKKVVENRRKKSESWTNSCGKLMRC